ncbi:sigma-70 family RNA polymerase sigma factor [Nostoc sp. FACHB-110]|uniref:sigma-70 family RNA polymerase sigma factor n=1 Tax=Nostoc sp. FACHB-110 TaxID=2692834 RepID=UPI001688956C|nr:sigma-70 family RNA polymerase sigma factor [Nostoc sp. FACHB-110]MBD2437355.1 sigma-70 family RNA polymerase sigma factor [Nostoc sp. FACHB-110]
MLSTRERNALAEANKKLVHKVVHRARATCREPYDDLFQIGYIGLLKAADRFDAATGNAFSSFAIPYIQGEIQHFLRDQWQLIKVPRTALETKAKVKRLQRNLATLGRETETSQIALGLGIKHEAWQSLDAIDSNLAVSLDEMIHEPVSAEESEEIDKELLLKYLGKLRDKQRTALLEKFFNNLSIEQIAKKQKLSPQQVKASVNLGLAKLKFLLLQEA